MITINAKSLSNYELLLKLRTLRQMERTTTVEVLQYLLEVESRGIYRDAGYDSMFTYMVEELKYSKGSAYRRAQCLKVLKVDSSALDQILRGNLSVSTLAEIGVVARNNGNVSEVLAQASGKSKEAVAKLVASEGLPVKPQRERIKARKVAKSTPPSSGSLFSAPNEVESKLESPSDISYSVAFEADQEFMKLYQKVKFLMPNHKTSMVEVFKALLADYEERNSPQKRQERRKERAEKKEVVKVEKVKVTNSNPRAIPASIKDQVKIRDNCQCCFIASDGTRCSAKANLEIDHILPVARHGNGEIENLRLLCRAHNQLMAERHFGRDFMKEKRMGCN